MKIIDSDPNFKKLLQNIAHMDRTKLGAGYIKSKNDKRRDKEDNIAIAAKLQLVGVGASRKKWPFMAQAFDKNKGAYEEGAVRAVSESLNSLDSKRFDRIINGVGVKMKSDIQTEIRTTTSPALSPQTIAKKKSSKPLIDTGQLLAAVSYEISKK